MLMITFYTCFMTFLIKRKGLFGERVVTLTKNKLKSLVNFLYIIINLSNLI